jgi:hypothetical protein
MFYKLIRLLAVLVSLLSSFTLFANECVKFRETLKQHAFWEPPQSESYIGYGFAPSYKHDEEKDEWNLDLDEYGLKIQQIYFDTPAWDVALLGEKDQQVNSRNSNIRITHIDEKELKTLSSKELDAVFNSNEITFTTLNIESGESLKKTIKKDEIDPPIDIDLTFWIDDLIDINPKDMQYTAEYYLEFSWIDNRWLELAKQDGLIDSSCGFKFTEIDTIEYQYWLPDIGLSNKVSVIDMSYEGPERNLLSAMIDSDNNFYFIRTIHETAVFNNPLDFSQFPFDRHDLVFQIETNAGYYEDFTIVPTDDTHAQADNMLDRVMVPEWDIQEINFDNSTFFWNEGDPYDNFYYTIPIQRQFYYYVYKLFIPIVLIMIICWSVFWIHSKEIETRLTVTVVSFLTLIAYNYVIVDDIPKIDNLTVFDSTILLAYLYAALSTLISIYSFQHFNKTSMAFSNLDRYSRFLGPLSFVVFVLVIFIYIFNKYSIAASLGLL